MKTNQNKAITEIKKKYENSDVNKINKATKIKKKVKEHDC